jgi:hypothetical protein
VNNDIVNGYKPVGGVSFAQNNKGVGYLLQAMYKNPAAAAAGGGGTKRSKNRSRRQ